MSNELIERMRKAAKCIYLATDKEVADDIADILNKAASAIQHCMQGEPVKWMGPHGGVYETKVYDNCIPLFTHANPDIAELKRDSRKKALLEVNHILINLIGKRSDDYWDDALREACDSVDELLAAVSASPL